MNIYDYLQVNSHYVYSKKLDLSFTDKLQKQKVKVKKYSNDEFCGLIENAVFGNKNIYIHIETKQGEFILTNVTNEIDNDNVQEYLKHNSYLAPTYYFSNVDYFSYGRFGFADNGKIVRYLSYNSEVQQGEDAVIWVGKPHDWEHKTHTFYTKKKIEDCEMGFGWDEVCQMSEFYLPFINKELNISACTLYGDDKNYLLELSKITKKSKNRFNKEQIKELYDVVKNNNSNDICFIVKMTQNNLIIDGQVLHVYNPNAPIEDQKILGVDKNYNMFYKFVDNQESSFYDILTKSLNEAKNSNIKSLTEYLQSKMQVKAVKKYYLMFKFISQYKFNIHLASYGADDELNRNVFIANKLTPKVSKTIYNLLLKWYEED